MAPVYQEATDEYIAHLSNDASKLYRPYVEKGQGVLVPAKGETLEAVKKGLNQAARKLGKRVRFFDDPDKPTAVVYEITVRQSRQTTPATASAAQQPVKPVPVVTPAAPWQQPIVVPLPDKTQDMIKDEVVNRPLDGAMESNEGFPPRFVMPAKAGGDEIGFPSLNGATNEADVITDDEDEEDTVAPEASFPPALTGTTDEATKPKRTRRTKEQIAADETAKLSKPTTYVIDESELPAVVEQAKAATVAEGTAFEGLATEEHPLVAAEKTAGTPAGRKCPSCGTTYSLAKICPRDGQMTVEIAEAVAA